MDAAVAVETVRRWLNWAQVPKRSRCEPDGGRHRPAAGLAINERGRLKWIKRDN